MSDTPPDLKVTPSAGARGKTVGMVSLGCPKALVDSERISYEQNLGTIPSPNHFLKLLTDDPWFAWLHPLSQLIVAMD